MKKHNKKQTEEENLLCKFAKVIAPQVSKFCTGTYYQPQEPNNMKEFLQKNSNS
ncbi:cyclic lactone autoinducer peptide [Agathobacter sp.]